MSGSNGLKKAINGNRENQVKNFNVKGDWVQSYPARMSTAVAAGFTPSKVGNIISTTQVPSTNPAPTNLTPQQFSETLYFDAGTTNSPINAPTLADFLTYQATKHNLEEVMTFKMFFINLKLEDPAANNSVSIVFNDPAWGRVGFAASILPQTAGEIDFTVFGATNAATAVAFGFNNQINNIDPGLIISGNNLGAITQFTIVDNSIGVTTTLTRDWVLSQIINNALAWGTAARLAGGFRDTDFKIVNPVGVVSAAASGFGAGAYCSTYFTGGQAPANIVHYVKADGRMRATVVAGAAYTAAVLADPATNEFGLAVSSARYKDLIKDAEEDSLSFFDKIRPRTFHFKEDLEKGIKKPLVGVIAEELGDALPAHLRETLLTYEFDHETNQRIVSGISDHHLTAALLANQRRLSDKILALETRLENFAASSQI